MSRRLNREWPSEAKGDSASILFASSLNYSCAPVWAREDSGNWQGPENFVHTLRRICSGSYPGSPHIFDRYSGSELTSLLCTDVRRMYD